MKYRKKKKIKTICLSYLYTFPFLFSYMNIFVFIYQYFHFYILKFSYPDVLEISFSVLWMDLTYINPKKKEDKPQKVIIVDDVKKFL